MGQEVEGDASELEANNSRPRNRRDSVGQTFIILIITLHLPWSSAGIFLGVNTTHSFSTSSSEFLRKIPEGDEGKKESGEHGLTSHGTTFMMHLMVGVHSRPHRFVICKRRRTKKLIPHTYDTSPYILTRVAGKMEHQSSLKAVNLTNCNFLSSIIRPLDNFETGKIEFWI